VRPTAARVRGALFDSLGPAIEDADVLDLFAGSGMLGIEALQRGARRAVFVERDPKQCRAVRKALADVGLAERAVVYAGDALRVVARLGEAGETFNLVVLDPPYGEGWIDRTLDVIRRTRVLRSRGMIVAEGHWRDRPAIDPPYRLLKEGRYGETALWYIRIESDQ
jgi:16S rRNA (guanine(966)-N(2))-methyltransferase RsmD